MKKLSDQCTGMMATSLTRAVPKVGNRARSSSTIPKGPTNCLEACYHAWTQVGLGGIVRGQKKG